jgi:uncharacterized protein (DUF1501 family)
MASTDKDPVLVVLQLSGGNDYLNTVIPHSNPLYRDNRPNLGIPEEEIIEIDDELGLHPSMGPIKEFFEEDKLAIIHGVGYANSPRSHFRSMDIWHTCEPDTMSSEGWLGKVIRELDPKKENVVTAVSFGPSMFRALAFPGVPVACVSGDLESYGILPGIDDAQRRAAILERVSNIYSPAIGSGPVMEYMGQTGLDSLEGAVILKVAPQKYTSSVEYPDNAIAKKLKGIAQVHLADLGTRILYVEHGSFDTHANQESVHSKLWDEVSGGVKAFFEDLKEHDTANNVIMFLFSEFGRRVRDNGSGTDHGAGGVAFVIGDRVKGGFYGEYPSLKAEDLVQGDLDPNLDFRGVYATILEDWLGLDPKPFVNGSFEQPRFLESA